MKGASFATYAGIRVRGAMLDEVRSTDWTPRSVYRRHVNLQRLFRQWKNRTGKPADAREIAAKLGVPLEEYFRMVTAAAAIALQPGPGRRRRRVPRAADRGSRHGAFGRARVREFREALAEAISNLPEREALVMSLYYEEESTEEIVTSGVTESAFCQIHGQR